MELTERCEKMLAELGISVAAFCRRVELSPSGYYRWKNGEISLSEKTLARIEAWLQKYNF